MGPEDGDYMNIATQVAMCQAHWDHFRDGVNFKAGANGEAESEDSDGTNRESANRGSDPNHQHPAGV